MLSIEASDDIYSTTWGNIPEDANSRNISWFQWQPLWKCLDGAIAMFNWTKRGKREKCRAWQLAGSNRQAAFSWKHDQIINVSWLQYQIFESMELNNSWEVNCRSVSQKFPFCLWKSRIYCRVQRRSPLEPFPSDINTAHLLKICIFKIFLLKWW